MSIPFSVAAVLARGALEEDNYAHIGHPEILRLVGRTDLQSEAGFTAAFPQKQGAEILVHLRNGNTIRQRLDNVVAATPQEIRTRFRQAAGAVIGDKRMQHLERVIDDCAGLSDSRAIAALCRLDPMKAASVKTGSGNQQWTVQ
jgi:2-methylcitrate dehydratase PrpD